VSRGSLTLENEVKWGGGRRGRIFWSLNDLSQASSDFHFFFFGNLSLELGLCERCHHCLFYK
jgi:hypothetical protein